MVGMGMDTLLAGQHRAEILMKIIALTKAVVDR